MVLFFYYNNSFSNSCGCFETERISEKYSKTHEKLNSALDKVRSMVLLQNNSLLIKTVLTLLFVSSIGTYLSTPACIIVCK